MIRCNLGSVETRTYHSKVLVTDEIRTKAAKTRRLVCSRLQIKQALLEIVCTRFARISTTKATKPTWVADVEEAKGLLGDMALGDKTVRVGEGRGGRVLNEGAVGCMVESGNAGGCVMGWNEGEGV